MKKESDDDTKGLESKTVDWKDYQEYEKQIEAEKKVDGKKNQENNKKKVRIVTKEELVLENQ